MKNIKSFYTLFSFILIASSSTMIQASPKPEVRKETHYIREPDVIFVPTPQEVVNRMLEVAQVKPGERVYDLGCGDGRIVVTAADKFKALAFGFDIDPERVEESIQNIKKHGVQSRASIQQADIFELDLSQADVVTLYLLPELNEKLIPQLRKLKNGARIVSHQFAMGNIPPDYTEVVKVGDSQREHTIYLWKKTERLFESEKTSKRKTN